MTEERTIIEFSKKFYEIYVQDNPGPGSKGYYVRIPNGNPLNIDFEEAKAQIKFDLKNQEMIIGFKEK